MWTFLSHGNRSLTSENFKLVSQRKVTPFHCPTNQNREGCWRCPPGQWTGRSAEGTQILGVSGEWRNRKEAASGEQSVLDCTEPNKVASITDHYYEAPEKFSCSEVLDRASDSPNASSGIWKGSQNSLSYCECRGPPTDRDISTGFS
jgi:hypothetical protein